MTKVALLLAVLGSTVLFAGCAKEESAKVESTQEVSTPSGDAEVQTETKVTTTTDQ